MEIASPTLIGGLLLGLASSLYCVGMCGGIASGLMLVFEPRTRLDRARVLMQAQLGRIFSYMLAGGAVGYAGSTVYGMIVPGAVYQVLQWSSGAMLVWIGLVIAGVLALPQSVHSATARVSRLAAWVVKPLSGIVAGPFLGGITWGFIPCPTVYGALLTAMLAGSGLGGVEVMAGFGLGTLPAVTLTAVGLTSLTRVNGHARMRRLVGGAIAVLGLATVVPGSPVNGMLCAPPPSSLVR
jgi:sulfite exporter TauE/SafE